MTKHKAKNRQKGTREGGVKCKARAKRAWQKGKEHDEHTKQKKSMLITLGCKPPKQNTRLFLQSMHCLLWQWRRHLRSKCRISPLVIILNPSPIPIPTFCLWPSPLPEGGYRQIDLQNFITVMKQATGNVRPIGTKPEIQTCSLQITWNFKHFDKLN